MNPTSIRPFSTEPITTPTLSNLRRNAFVTAYWLLLRNVLGLLVALFLYTELLRILTILTPFSIESTIPIAALTLQEFLRSLWALVYGYSRYAVSGMHICFLIIGLLHWGSRWISRRMATLVGIGAGLPFVAIFILFNHNIETYSQLHTLPHLFAPYLLGTNYLPGVDLWFPWAAAIVFVASCGMVGRLFYSYWGVTTEPTAKRWEDWLWEIGGVLIVMGMVSAGVSIEHAYLDTPIVKDGFALKLTDLTLQSSPDPTHHRVIVELQAINYSLTDLSLNSGRTVIAYAFKLLDQFGNNYEGTVMDRMPEVGEPLQSGMPFFSGTRGSITRVWLIYEIPISSVPLSLYHEYHSSSKHETEPYFVKLSPSPFKPVPAANSPLPPLLPSPNASYYLDVRGIEDFAPAASTPLTHSRVVVVSVELRDDASGAVVDKSGYLTLIDSNGVWYQPSESTRFTSAYAVHDHYPYWGAERGGQELFVIPLEAEPRTLLYQNRDGARVLAPLPD